MTSVSSPEGGYVLEPVTPAPLSPQREKAIKLRLAKAKTNLVLGHPFVGSIALNLPYNINQSIPTARTNGKVIEFNPDFVESLNDEELVFLVAHECFHPMLEHNFRRGERDHRKWNQAGDYIINQLLTDEKIGKMPKQGLLNKATYDAGGGTTDGVYNILPDNPDGDDPLDDCADDDGTPAEREQQKAEWKVKVAQAAQAAKMMGKLSVNLARLVDEVLQPKVDWRDVLQRFVQKAKTDSRTFARANRRFIQQGLYLPTISGETLGEIVFCVDMSGSIDQKTADQFAAEGRKVFEDLQPSKMHFIFFSHNVCGHDAIERGDDFVFNPRGGGGTAFSPCFKYMEEHNINPVACVFLTDLCCDDFGDSPDYPVLWVSTENGTAPFGEVVLM
jgi:predicted metal-dependent peptidase